ncbi:hypothetical protein [Pseudomonas putida]|uniref:hypothetical protein n=1 Tax=Pseudomonas putida TaxID=303 RepID=UPI0012603597|nr:hypothetical protein [Pseudomonas putida]
MKFTFQGETLNIHDRMSWVIAKALDNGYAGLRVYRNEKPSLTIYPEQLNYNFSQNGSHIESIEIVGRKASENAEDNSVRDASDWCAVHIPGGSPDKYVISGDSAYGMIATADGKKFKFNGEYYTSYINMINLPEAGAEGGLVPGLQVGMTLVPA